MAENLSPAREAAFLALMNCEKNKAWSDQAIRNASKRRKLSARDAALASNLCYGVIQNQLLLDFWINAISTTPTEKLDLEVKISLRIALYQINFLDRVPVSAAVNESVGLVRKYTHNKGAASLANAVLRNFQRKKERPNPGPENPLYALSINYSHPLPLVKLLAEELGDNVEALLCANNSYVKTVIQCNPLRTTLNALKKELEFCGVSTESHPWLEDCLLISKSGNLEQLSAFQTGKFYVQDTSSRLCSIVADPKPGEKILDACAAPGGKSFALALAAEDQAEILSQDLHENKLSRITSGARRLGISCIQTSAADARIYQPNLDGQFDLVLADVPCSGLGIIRKKPDIRYKDLQEIESLPKIQGDILNNLAHYVRPGGRLIYSTCTILHRENQDVISRFISKHPDFVLEPFILPASIKAENGEITLWPHIHGTDGFFIAKLRRINV